MKRLLILTTAIILNMALSINLLANDTIRMVWQVWEQQSKSFQIVATSGKTFNIDWGDNSPVETKTATGSPQWLSHTYDNSNFFTVTVSAASSNCFFTVLNCSLGPLYSLDVSNSPKLTELYCYTNLLSSLNISNNPQLIYLDCSNNLLSSLDVSNNPLLVRLECWRNQLSSLDVSNNPQLAWLYCYSNQLNILNVSNNPKLTLLECWKNQLNTLDVSNRPLLTWLECWGNQLSSLNVSNNPQLTWLYCDSNQITSLDISNSPLLIELYCSNNQLSSLDVSNNPLLTWLYCDSNQLSSLDISKNPRLEWLRCSSNGLSSLDISGNPQLTFLYCFNNYLPLIDLYAASQQISNADNKHLGTQRLPAQIAMTDIAIFSSQAEFSGVPTVFYVEKDGVQADSAIDYIVSNGLVFKNTGNYTVTMTNDTIKSYQDYPAKVIVDITVDFGNGIVETDNYPSLRIYPNPASEHLFIKFTEPQTADYSIFNIMGQIVKQGTLQGDDMINVSSLTKGTYFLKIAGATVKFVKI